MRQTSNDTQTNTSNLLGLDYAAEAKRLGPPVCPIIDIHAHINGKRASEIYKETMDQYGIERVFSMTPLPLAETTQQVLGDRVEFIAVPNWRSEDRLHEFTDGYLDTIRSFHAMGSRIVKFWVAPRVRDIARMIGDDNLFALDAPSRLKAMELAAELGMSIMVHCADPDTWFQTKYADAELYGTKASQYEPLERCLNEFKQPWIAAHMGGSPEDLTFLTGLLERHDHLHLDTSACKWQVREWSRHQRADLVTFLEKFRGRILYGSDIVTTDEHLQPSDDEQPMDKKASSESEAYDLYASRYWAYRTMFETDYNGPSPISDPDLAMVDPDNHGPDDSPPLVGRSLNDDLLRVIYRDAALGFLEKTDN